MEMLLALLGGLGIGSVVNSLVTSYIGKKNKKNERLYEEKKAVYEGLLNAIYEAAVSPSDRHSKSYGLWQTKCSLFGSVDVSKYAKELMETDNGQEEKRVMAYENLIDAMKKDLLKS